MKMPYRDAHVRTWQKAFSERIGQNTVRGLPRTNRAGGMRGIGTTPTTTPQQHGGEQEKRKTVVCGIPFNSVRRSFFDLLLRGCVGERIRFSLLKRERVLVSLVKREKRWGEGFGLSGEGRIS